MSSTSPRITTRTISATTVSSPTARSSSRRRWPSSASSTWTGSRRSPETPTQAEEVVLLALSQGVDELLESAHPHLHGTLTGRRRVDGDVVDLFPDGLERPDEAGARDLDRLEPGPETGRSHKRSRPLRGVEERHGATLVHQDGERPGAGDHVLEEEHVGGLGHLTGGHGSGRARGHRHEDYQILLRLVADTV